MQQAEAAECGLACLGMIAAHQGLKISLAELRRRFPTSLRGAALNDLVDAASQLGLIARPLRLELEELADVRFPVLAHWDLKHFVVIRGRVRSGYKVFDPALGVRTFSDEELSRRLSGVVVEFDRAEGFSTLDASARLRMRDFWKDQPGVGTAFGQLLGLSLLLQLVGIASPLYVQFVVDEVLIKRDVELLSGLALGFGMILVVQLVLKALRALVLLYSGNQLAVNLTGAIMRRLLRLPLGYFEKRHQGDVLSRIGSLTPVREFLTRGIVEALLNGVTVVITLVVMLCYDLLLTGIVIGSLLIYGVIKTVTLPYLKRLSQEQIHAAADENSHVIESLATIQATKLGNLEARRERLWHRLFMRTVNASVVVERLRIGLSLGNMGVSGVEQILVVFLGAGLVIDGALTIGALYAFLAFKSQFADGARGLIEQLIGYRLLRIHLDRLEDILLEEPEATEYHRLRSPRAIVDGISLHGVSFRYGSGETWVLRDVDLNFANGQLIVVLGASGTGKSTLVKLLLGLLEPVRGSVRIDGMDLERYGRDLLRRSTGVVMQNDQLFTGTVGENISAFDTSPDLERVREAARRARIDMEVEAMRLGYNSLIGDRGASLSGGQRQRLLLARALYTNPDVIVLDEGTANLPPDVEQEIFRMLRARRGIRVLVTHRLELVKHADSVVLFDLDHGVQQFSRDAFLSKHVHARAAVEDIPSTPIPAH
jgi:ATP-binding cassette subfamily B protein RaxB